MWNGVKDFGKIQHKIQQQTVPHCSKHNDQLSTASTSKQMVDLLALKPNGTEVMAH